MLTFGTYKKPVFQWEKVMRDVDSLLEVAVDFSVSRDRVF